LFFLSKSQTEGKGALVQAIIGGAVVTGAAVSWWWPSLARPYLLLAGLLLVGAVIWYPIFMLDAMSRRDGTGHTNFSHAPGALALGLAFGVRLLIDFGMSEDARIRIARPAGIAAMATGGGLDLLVLQQMMARF
jgi:hypothetical protein